MLVIVVDGGVALLSDSGCYLGEIVCGGDGGDGGGDGGDRGLGLDGGGFYAIVFNGGRWVWVWR